MKFSEPPKRDGSPHQLNFDPRQLIVSFEYVGEWIFLFPQ
jgi:hypothetical protein